MSHRLIPQLPDFTPKAVKAVELSTPSAENESLRVCRRDFLNAATEKNLSTRLSELQDSYRAQREIKVILYFFNNCAVSLKFFFYEACVHLSAEAS